MPEWLTNIPSWFINILISVASVLGTLTAIYLRFRKGISGILLVEKKAAEEAWTKQINRNEAEIARLVARQLTYEAKIDKIQDEHQSCIEEQAKATARYIVLENQVIQLQKMATAASVAISCSITADENGIIQDADMTVRDVLGYMPNQLIGESVDIIIPRDIQPRHHQGLERARISKFIRPPNIAVQSFALTRDGRRIPVIVSLTGVKDENGQQFVKAQIVHRVVFDVIDIAHGSHEHTPISSERRVENQPTADPKRKTDEFKKG